jgi:hypothetical protein
MVNMKTVLLGNTRLDYSWFIKTYREGLQLNGCEVKEIDYKTTAIESIKQQLIDYKPYAVFTHLTFHHFHDTTRMMEMFSQLYREHDIKFIHTCNDARSVDRLMIDVSNVFHAAFVGTHTMVENCSDAFNIPVYYSPYSSLCYDSMSPPAEDLRFEDPVFTGSPDSHPDRKDFLNKLQAITKVVVFKTQSGNDLRHRTPELSVSAKCILGLCTGYDIPGYIDVRPFQYLGTGAFMASRRFMHMESIIPDDLYLPFDDYSEESAHYIIDEIKSFGWNTESIRKKAFKFIQEKHSCRTRIREVLDLIRRS